MDEQKYIKRKERAIAERNREQIAASCNSLGDHYNQQGKYQDAVEQYLEEATLYAALDKPLELAKAHRMVGEMFMLLSEFDSAKEHINVYLKTAKNLHNRVEEQRAHTTLGRAFLLHGQSLAEISTSSAMEQLKHAEKAFLKSLLLIKDLSGQISKVDQADMQARCYLNMGVVKEHMEQFQESIEYIDKAIKISKAHDIFELTHLCLISKSLLYNYKKNDATLALRYCNLALEVAKRLPNRVKKICETLITKADILVREADFASAKQILTKAYKKNTPDENDRAAIERCLRLVVKICQILDELVTVSSVDYAQQKTLYERLGDACCHLQNYNKALEYYLQMLDCARRNGESGKSLVPIYVSLYQTYKDNKQFDKALEYLWQEYELNKDMPTEAFNTLCSIAEICELQKQPFWTTYEVYQKAKDQAEKAGDARLKLEKIVYVRIRKLQLKHNMGGLAEALAQEAASKGINVDDEDDSDDSDTESCAMEQNTPELGDDVCLDDLTDSDTSDLDETEKPRPHRATRGTRALTIKRNAKGETQLHQACIVGNLELVRHLLEQGHPVNVRDHAGWLPLHEACNHGFYGIVEMLLDKGASINDKGGTSCDGITPLYDACCNGQLDVILLLLERGVDATLKTDFGETCIDGLDKWRRTASLTDGEQAQYEQVRATLLKRLSRVGICSAEKSKPLTNANTKSVNAVRRNMSSSALLSDEEDDVRPSTSRRADERMKILKDCNKPTTRPPAATTEYKNVMEQLKRPHRMAPLDDEHFSAMPSSSPGPSLQKRGALLAEEEVDPDTWLIDDMGPEKKRRRYHMPSSAPANKTLSKENLHDSANSTWEMESATGEADAFQLLLEGANAGTSTQQRQKNAKKLRLSRSSSMSSNSSGRAKAKQQQASLLDSGFCRFRSESPLFSDESRDTYVAGGEVFIPEPDSTTTSLHLLISPAKSSPVKIQAKQVLPTTVSFKIKVEDELLLVPIEHKKLSDINIRWLAEEASRRYYNLVGLKPVLRLKTTDGFAYEENDAVSVALEQNVILATVLEWKTAPLPQRYAEMCRQMNKDMNSEVQNILERAQSSNVLQLNDFWLSPPQTEPIFKALLHQSNLRILDLPNNFMQNEGCRQLGKALPTLIQLKTLNLKGNFISADGLESLLTCFGIDKLLSLEELNLSDNPLGNSCVSVLHKFCNSAAGRSLQKLMLANCSLTTLFDFDLGYHWLTAFDVSFNQLSHAALQSLLAKLNSCRLQHLNLSYSKAVNADERSLLANAERIVDLFEGGTCEKFQRVELGGCYLSDANLLKIVQCLSKANELELLDITDNSRLSSASWRSILNEVPQLRKIIATNCTRLLDEEGVQQFVQSKQMPNMLSLTLEEDTVKAPEFNQRLCDAWRAHWSDKGKVKRYARQLLLYVHDKDLSN